MQGEGMKKKVIFGFFWRFSERIVAQSISLIVSIVLARLLLPEDYGAVALVMVFITIADVFVNNGLGNALIQKMDADDIDFSSVFYTPLNSTIKIPSVFLKNQLLQQPVLFQYP